MTRVEQDLVAAVVNGDLLDLAGDRPTDEAAMQSWGVSRTIRAWVIRDVVRGRLAPDPDPRGLRLRGARIDGRIDLENIAEDLEVQLRDCLLPEGLLLNDARLLTLSLKGCRIGGRGPTVEAPVHADRFSSRALSLVGATVSGNCAEGVLRLESARIGAVDCSGARLVNDSGPAFHGNGLQVEHNLVLSEGFAADGAGANGTVCLHEARVGAQFDCSGSRLHNPSGPALACDGMEVGADVFLVDGFAATGHGDQGAVRFIGAHIGGSLHCGPATLHNPEGCALFAEDVRIDHDLMLRDGFDAIGAGRRGTVQLPGADIGGTLWIETKGIRQTRPGSEALVDLYGAVYADLPEPGTVDDWLDLIGRRNVEYGAQPYQQLAEVHRAAGHDRAVRTILMAQRRDQIHRGAVIGWDRFWARLTGLTLGYGYQPWRALIVLLVVLAISVGATLTAGHRGALARTSGTSTPRAACSVTEQIGVGLDLGIPLLKTGARDQCAPTTTSAGQALTVTGWALQILAWAFAALFVAGFTGAVRKT